MSLTPGARLGAYEVTAKMDSRPLGGMTVLSGEREQLFAAT